MKYYILKNKYESLIFKKNIRLAALVIAHYIHQYIAT